MHLLAIERISRLAAPVCPVLPLVTVFSVKKKRAENLLIFRSFTVKLLLLLA